MADSGSGSGKEAGSPAAAAVAAASASGTATAATAAAAARVPNLTMSGASTSGGAEERQILLGHEVADEFERFFAGLEEYVPTIPDELTNTVLAKSGFHCPDVRVTRLISLAAQKFVADVVHDSLQYAKVRQQSGTKDKSRNAKSQKQVLTSEDLANALREYGIDATKQEYFVSDEDQET